MIHHRFLQLFIICLPFIFSFATLDPTLNIRFLSLALVTCILSIYYIFKRKKIVRAVFLTPVALLYLFIIIFYYFSFIYNGSSADSIFIIIKLFLGYILFIMISSQILEYSSRDFIRSAVVCLSFISIIFYLQFFITALDQNKISMFSSTMANRNLLASFIYLCFPFLIDTIISDNKRWRTYAILIVLITFPALVMTNSFAVFIATLIFSFVFIVILKGYYNRRNLLYFLSVFIMVAISINTYFQKKDKFYNYNEKIVTFISDKSSSRLALYKSTFALIKDNFIFGVGPGNWKTRIQEYGLYKQDILDHTRYNGSSSPQRPHNDFLWVFSEAGFIAGISFLLLFLILIRDSYYSYLKEKKNPLNLLISASLLGFLFISLVDFPLERVSHNIIFLLLIAVYATNVLKKEKYSESLTPVWIPYIFLIITVFAVYIGYIRYIGEKHTAKAIRYKNDSNWNMVIKEIDLAYNKNIYTLDNTSSPLLWHKGLAYIKQDNIKDALKFFLAGYNDNVNHIHSLNNIATCYGILGDVESAKKYYYKALDIIPTFRESRVNLAILFYNQKEYVKSLDVILQSQIDDYSTRIKNNDKFDYYLSIIFQSYVSNLPDLTNEELFVFNKIIDQFDHQDLQGKSTFYLQKAYMLKQENNKTYRDIILQIYN